jgi:hypothetical protein
MGYQKVREFTVDGTTTQIDVDTTSGDFSAVLDGERVKLSTLKGLQEKIKRHIRTSRKIAIPITLLDDYAPGSDKKLEIQQVTLTGIHGGSGNVIARNDKTKEVQQLRYFWGTAVRRLTGGEIQEFVQLVKTSRAAAQAVEDWVEERKVTPAALVQKAAEGLDPALDQNTEAQA